MALPAIGDGEQIGDGNTSESLLVGKAGQPLKLGNSAATTIGMYGATPVVQRATAASHTTISSVASVSTTTGAITSWGFSTSTQANTLTAAVAEIQATLVALGVWAA